MEKKKLPGILKNKSVEDVMESQKEHAKALRRIKNKRYWKKLKQRDNDKT